jgi:Glycosyl transferases group 1
MFAKPVIACHAGAAGEVIADGETGLLTAPGDAMALADAIAALAGDPARRERLGQAGRAVYQQCFTAPGVARRRVEALLQIARRPVPQYRVRIDGVTRRVDVGECGSGLLLDRRTRLSYHDVGGALFLTFLRHDRGGVAEIHLNGARLAEYDLYSAKRQIQTVRVGAAGAGALIEVTQGLHRNPLANASEIIVIAAEES